MLNISQQVQDFLEKSDYATVAYHGCFDVAAKKEILLLLKTLYNIDSFQKEQARNLKIISNNLDAHPLIVGTHTRRESLKSGVVYERFELPTVSLETFEDLIVNGIFPKIYRDRGGMYVQVDSEVLKEARTNRGMTQRELAEAVGINKKVIYEHEKKQLRMLLEIAQRLEKILENKIITPAEVFKKYEEHGVPKDELEKSIEIHLKKLGFKTDFVKQAPFDVFAREKSMIISDIESNRRKMKKRVISLKAFVNIVKKPTVLITERTKEDQILGIPVVQRKELEGYQTGKELIKKAKRVSYEAV